MRVVIDTNVLARALLASSGPAAELLRLCIAQPHFLVTSPFILLELARVLRYDRLRILHGRLDEELDQFVYDIQVASYLVIPAQGAALVVPQDPDDNPIVQTAVLGQAEVLCTRDRHLHVPAVTNFCRERGISVLNDLDLLTRLKKSQTPY